MAQSPSQTTAAAVPAEVKEYIVDNSALLSETFGGLALSRSRTLKDFADEMDPAKCVSWGSTVRGEEQDGWLKLPDGLFLPMSLEGKLVLTLKEPTPAPTMPTGTPAPAVAEPAAGASSVAAAPVAMPEPATQELMPAVAPAPAVAAPAVDATSIPPLPRPPLVSVRSNILPAVLRGAIGNEEQWSGILARSDIIEHSSEDSGELSKQHTHPEELQDRMKAFELTGPGPVAQELSKMTAEVHACHATMRKMLGEGSSRLKERTQAVCDDDNAGQVEDLERIGKRAVAEVAAASDMVGDVVNPKNFPKILVARADRHGTGAKEDQRKVLKEERDERIAARHETVVHHCDALVRQTGWQESFGRLHGDSALSGKLAAHYGDAELYEQQMSATHKSIVDFHGEISQKQSACVEALTLVASRRKRTGEVAQKKWNDAVEALAMYNDDCVEENLLCKANQGLEAEVAKVAEEKTKAGAEKEFGHQACDAVKKNARLYEEATDANYRDAMEAAAESKAGCVAACAFNAKLAGSYGQLASKEKRSELEHLLWEFSHQHERLEQLQRQKASDQPTMDSFDLDFSIHCESDKLQALEEKIEACRIDIEQMVNRIRAAEEVFEGLKDFQMHGQALDGNQLDAKAAKMAEDSWGDLKLFVIPVAASGGSGSGASAAAASSAPSAAAAAAVDSGTAAAPEVAAATVQLQKMLPDIARMMERLRQSDMREEDLRFQNESLFLQRDSLRQQIEDLQRQLGGLDEAGQRALCDAAEMADGASDASWEHAEVPQLDGERG